MTGVLKAALELQTFCRKQGWRFCFIGGVALQRWGDPRVTVDANLTLFTGFFGEEQFVELLLDQFRARGPDERSNAIFRRVVLLYSAEGVNLDIALGALPFQKNSVQRASDWLLDDGENLTTCSAEDLIVHKAFASRPKDWLDVESIVMRQGRKLNIEQIWAELRPLVELKEEPEILAKLQKIFDEVLDFARESERPVRAPVEQILGIPFFQGTAESAAAAMSAHGGLLVAPSGTCFERFVEDEDYRRAVVSADLVLPDSGLMVTLWRLLAGRTIQRISGLAYLKQLLRSPGFSSEKSALWILPNEQARARLLLSAERWKLEIMIDDCYVAPIYRREVRDAALLAAIDAREPRQIVIGIGAGPQEKLGFYLRENLSFRPSIHCIGGALGFLTGDQVAIPDWADRYYLGWFLRLLRNPRVFIPRLWRGRVLPRLLWRYRANLPPIRGSGSQPG